MRDSPVVDTCSHPRADPGEALRILLIRLGAVGDVVRTLPAIEPLRARFPQASLSWIAEDGPASLLDGHPLIEEVIRLPRRDLSRLLGEPATFGEGVTLLTGFTRRLRRRRFDLTLDFQGTLKSGLISRAAAAPRRIGYRPPGSKEGNRFFQTELVSIPATPIHRVERTLALVRAIGAPGLPVRATIPIGPGDRTLVDDWWQAAGLPNAGCIVLYPGTSEAQRWKRYPVDRLAEAAGLLAARSGATLIVAGGPGEESLVERVAAGAPGAAVVAPVLSLKQLAELIRRTALFIGSDTGPMHIAWAVGTRVLALFGPTDPRLNAPWGEGHRVLYNRLSSRRGIDSEWPDPEQVCSAALELLESRT